MLNVSRSCFVLIISERKWHHYSLTHHTFIETVKSKTTYHRFYWRHISRGFLVYTLLAPYTTAADFCRWSSALYQIPVSKYAYMCITVDMNEHGQKVWTHNNAGMGLMIVGGMHAVEPLLTSCIPEVYHINQNINHHYYYHSSLHALADHQVLKTDQLESSDCRLQCCNWIVWGRMYSAAVVCWH